MGHRSEIRVHAAWSEPPVLWVIVGAGTGTRKSAALRQVLAPLLALADDRKQQQQQQQLGQEGLVTAGLQLPVVYTGRSVFQLFSVGLPAFSVLSVSVSAAKGVHCTLYVLVCVYVLAGLR